MKIIFVCTGNTCRSPMAEAIAKYIIKQKKIEGVTVASYGIAVNPMDCVTQPKAINALKSLGIPIRSKKAKQLTAGVVASADIIVTMTVQQKLMISGGNVKSISEITGAFDIADPYGGSQEAYDRTAFMLRLAVETLINKIMEE